tara:strand:- start:79 stop:222 length:144 start_codon:yes stop_codon:yes gene_type:complete
MMMKIVLTVLAVDVTVRVKILIQDCLVKNVAVRELFLKKRVDTTLFL